MTKKQKLELTWIGKENRPKLEPRILLEDPERSYHAKQRVSENDIFDNRLIFGDNLLALKALEQEFAGKVKCVYIDPPFNTGEMFVHYDDGVEHSGRAVRMTLFADRITKSSMDAGSSLISFLASLSDSPKCFANAFVSVTMFHSSWGSSTLVMYCP